MLKAGTYISVLMRQLNLFFGHELSDVEITASELMYLSQLYNRDGLTQEEMAAVITVDKAATTRTIQGMEKKGLVRREVLYETTSEFLDYFGLPNIDALPELPNTITEVEDEEVEETDLYKSKYKETEVSA